MRAVANGEGEGVFGPADLVAPGTKSEDGAGVRGQDLRSGGRHKGASHLGGDLGAGDAGVTASAGLLSGELGIVRDLAGRPPWGVLQMLTGGGWSHRCDGVRRKRERGCHHSPAQEKKQRRFPSGSKHQQGKH
jgi:hypothetical protein